jgi:tetratricopeptide (TPR) repeat protein
MALGEFALAQQSLIKGVNSSSEWAGEHDVFAMLADIAVRKRDHDMLRCYTPLAEENAARYDHILYRAIAQRAWGVIYNLEGKYPEAEERFNQALALFQEMGALWQTGRTLFELGDLARSSGNIAASREWFKGALTAFETIQAVPDIDKIRQLMAEL